tara:strand:+ start:914 stop:1111 length:198 start_codon:yes stop_codon:yes gene_type:complete
MAEKETWKSFLQKERFKEKQRKESFNKRMERVNTKSFWQKQSFGAAPKAANIEDQYLDKKTSDDH